MILSDGQKDIIRWYWEEHRTIGEIAEWTDTSYRHVRREIDVLRAIFASHGQELPCFNRGRPRTAPDAAYAGAA